MERVKLSKPAKRVLRLLEQRIYQCPADMPKHVFNAGVFELKRRGFAVAHQEESGSVVASVLTDDGRQYLAENPSLRNPIDWKWIVATTIAVIAAIGAYVALFVACTQK